MIENKRVLGLLGLCTKAGNIVYGTDACIEKIQKNKIQLIIVATDAADRTKRNFEFYCSQKNIPIIMFSTKEELSKSIGQKNKAVIGITNNSFAEQISKIINGGDIIG